MQEKLELILRDENLRLPAEVRLELIRALSVDGTEGLTGYFAINPSAGLMYRKAIRDYAFRLVERGIERMENAKSSGSLSPEDQRLATEELQSILDSIEQLCLRGIRRAIEGRQNG
jgi:hypothetical protein